MLDDELAEAHQQLLQLADVDGVAAAHALQCREHTRPLHHPPRQRGGERRQRERAVAEHLHELSAEPNSSTGPNCGSIVLPMISS
jgi:hypothetical protein